MRPIGSLLLGAIGDKYGTGAALKWSIVLMTLPTVVTGCLPTYKVAGLWAPFLLLVCRLLQVRALLFCPPNTPLLIHPSSTHLPTHPLLFSRASAWGASSSALFCIPPTILPAASVASFAALSACLAGTYVARGAVCSPASKSTFPPFFQRVPFSPLFPKA